MPDDELFEVVDPSGLTDADWTAINQLQRAYKEGGKRALEKAMGKLARGEPARFMAVIDAFFPGMGREVIRDGMAERGMTEEDLRELVRKLESRVPDQ